MVVIISSQKNEVFFPSYFMVVPWRKVDVKCQIESFLLKSLKRMIEKHQERIRPIFLSSLEKKIAKLCSTLQTF